MYKPMDVSNNAIERATRPGSLLGDPLEFFVTHKTFWNVSGYMHIGNSDNMSLLINCALLDLGPLYYKRV